MFGCSTGVFTGASGSSDGSGALGLLGASGAAGVSGPAGGWTAGTSVSPETALRTPSATLANRMLEQAHPALQPASTSASSSGSTRFNREIPAVFIIFFMLPVYYIPDRFYTPGLHIFFNFGAADENGRIPHRFPLVLRRET